MPHLADARLKWSPLNEPPCILDHAACLLESPRRQRVCIFGCGRGALEAPLRDPTWDVWALNLIPPFDSNRRVRADLWWDIHQRVAQTDQDLAWIRRCPLPIMVPGDLLDAGPMCVRYPIERVESQVAAGPLACTFALQIAYALMVGYREIGLYGVELAWGTKRERTVEWASVNWWIGWAESRGVKIVRPRASRLGRHPYRYGLDYTAELEDTRSYVDHLNEIDEIEVSVGG